MRIPYRYSRRRKGCRHRRRTHRREIAYELALQGKQPVIVEMKNDLIAQTGVCLANSSYLREWFAWKKVPVYLETTLQEVKDDSIVCKDASGKEITIPVTV